MRVDAIKVRVAAIFGFLAVGLGALGAHGLETSWKATLLEEVAARRVEFWQTASHYHLVHAVVLLVLAFAFPEKAQGRGAFWSFVAGILVFSGSLYVLCLTGVHRLGMITPIGGLLLMLGWVLLIFSGKTSGRINLVK